MVRRTYTYGSITLGGKKEKKKKKKTQRRDFGGGSVGLGKFEAEPDLPGLNLERLARDRRLGLSQMKEHVPISDYTPLSPEEYLRISRRNEERMEATRERGRQIPTPPPLPTVSVQPSEPTEQDFFSADPVPTAPVHASGAGA